MFPSAKMAENPVQPLVDKMVVNSVDHRITGEPSLSSASRSSMDVNFSAKQSLPKLNSFDGAQTPSPIPGLRPPTGKKSSFQITRVITKPNDFNIDDQETDDLDETNTEDMSSDILDISKTSGVIEPDPSSEDTVEMAPEAEESSNARDVNPKPPPQPPQEEDLGQIEEKDKLGDGSRFKVVKIESKEPFRRGRWKCLDFLDPPPTSEKVVFSEKLTERTSEENFVGSGNSSAASSVHYVPGVDDPSKNPLSTSATYIDDYTNSIVEPQPVYPGGYQPQSQQMTNGIGIDFAQGSVPHQSTPNMPLYDSQNTSSMGAGPSQSGQPSAAPSTETLPSSISSQPPGSSQQSMPSQPPSQSHVLSAQVPTTITHNHIPPPSSLPGDLSSQSLASSSFDATQSGQNVNVSQVGQQGTIHENNDFQQPAASQPQSITQTPLQNQDFDSYQTGTSSQTNLNPNVGAAASQTNVNPTQTTVSTGDVVQSPGQVSQAGSGAPSKNTSPNDEKVQGNDFMSQDRGYATGPAIPEKKSEVVPIETRRVDEMNLFKSAAGLTPPLLEMVSATMHPHMTAKDDDESGASTVAIDNKIEQAMDLVKSHLMFAVREEVEVLKEQIKELLEKNSQLEYENTILKAAATPETMSKINQSQPPASSS